MNCESWCNLNSNQLIDCFRVALLLVNSTTNWNRDTTELRQDKTRNQSRNVLPNQFYGHHNYRPVTVFTPKKILFCNFSRTASKHDIIKSWSFNDLNPTQHNTCFRRNYFLRLWITNCSAKPNVRIDIIVMFEMVIDRIASPKVSSLCLLFFFENVIEHVILAFLKVAQWYLQHTITIILLCFSYTWQI